MTVWVRRIGHAGGTGGTRCGTTNRGKLIGLPWVLLVIPTASSTEAPARCPNRQMTACRRRAVRLGPVPLLCGIAAPGGAPAAPVKP